LVAPHKGKGDEKAHSQKGAKKKTRRKKRKGQHRGVQKCKGFWSSRPPPDIGMKKQRSRGRELAIEIKKEGSGGNFKCHRLERKEKKISDWRCGGISKWGTFDMPKTPNQNAKIWRKRTGPYSAGS